MEDYTWSTENSLANNEQNMIDFIDNHMKKHCGEDYEVVYDDGTYLEIQNESGTLYAVRAMGNGDFKNHKVTFEELK